LEYYYFQRLYKLYRDHGGANDFKFTIICADGGSPLRVVERASVERPGAYRERWCVIDVEYPESERLSQAIALAESRRINIALTNPSFDAFALAHLRRLTSNDGPGVRDFKIALACEMKREFSTSGGMDFIADILGSDCCNLPRAADNMSSCNGISDVRRQIRSTNVHLLVRLLFPPQPSPPAGMVPS
jgi:hypothetical protein